MLYLFGPKETDFINGDSDLIHHTYDEVVDRSKGFYLKFKVALDKDERYKDIKKEMIISAYTPDGWNQFRVFDIYNHTNHVEVVATQLHYDLNYKKVFPFVVNKTTAQTALNVFVENFKSDLPNFKFTSNINDVHSFSTDDDLERLEEGHNALEILNRIASRWGGELKVDGYNVHLTHKLGEFTNALLYEHKNISEFVDETSMSEIITRIHAVSRFRPEREEGSSEEPEEVTIKVVVDSPLINEYAQVYEEDYTNNDARTRDQLIAWARLKYTTDNIDKPARSIKVETNIIDGQEINYGDDLVLKYTKHDVDEIIRCVGYQYNPNSGQYISVTLGSNLNSLTSTITGSVHDSTKNQLSNIEKQVQIIKYAANNHNRVTTGPLPIPDPIEGDMWYYHPDGRPNDVELRIFQDGGWVTIISDMTGENVRRAIADLELEADALAEEIIASDQKAAAAKEEAGLAKNAVDAFGIITQETADKMVDVEQIVADAESNAAGALAEASQAKTDATDALAKARESATNSSGALALAGQAATDSQIAIDAAEAAKTDAQTAMSNAQSALSTAGSADSKAGQAIAKADAIPTTIAGIIADKNLVNGSYVDTKVDAATGAWSQELVRVEGVIDGIEIGGRNLYLNSRGSTVSHYPSTFHISGDKEVLTDTTIPSGHYLRIHNTSIIGSTPSIYLMGSDLNRFSENIAGKKVMLSLYMRGSEPFKFHSRTIGTTWTKVTFTHTLSAHNHHFYLYPADGTAVDISSIKVEYGNKTTDWSPAPEDLYSQEEFKLFNAQYTQDVEGMTGRLTTVENGKLDGSTFQTFKQSEYQVTADKVASTVERVDTAEGLITTQGTAISQNATAIASKANTTTVNTLTGRVDTAESDISQNATAISSKASQTEVDTVKGTVSTHTSTLSQQAKDISARLTQSQVDTLVSDKGYSTVSYVDTEISATAGAIRTEMTAIEGKIPTEIGGRNLFRKSIITPNIDSTKDFYLNGWAGQLVNNQDLLSILEEGKTYTLSYDVELTERTDIPNVYSYNAGLYLYSPSTHNDVGFYGNVKELNEKDRVEITFVCPPLSDQRLLYYTNRYTTGGSEPVGRDTLNITNLKLEKGDVATDWTPAPEDMLQQSDFNTFKAEYEQSAQGWSSKLLQIEQADYASKTWSNQTFATPQSVTTQLASYAKTTDLNGMVTETSLTNKNYITSSAVNTLLTSYAKTTALNGMVTETSLSNKNYITASAVNTLLSSYAKTSALNGMVTETSLSNKNFATASSVTTQLQAYAKTTDLNGLATESYVGTQINTTAEGIRTEMTEVVGKIPTAVGGRNLFKGSTGSDINDYMATFHIGGTKSILTDAAVPTGHFLRITNFSETGTSPSVYIAGNSSTMSRDMRGKTVTLSMYLRGDAPFIFYGQEVKTSWTRVHTTLKFGTSNAHLYIRDAGQNIVDISSIKVEEGHTLTHWSLAPEDVFMQNDFNTFKASYDQSAQGWSAKLLQIEQANYATQTWSNQTFATPQSVTTQLSSYAKTTALNGMVTETTLASKNFITSSAVNTLLSSYAKTTALNGMVTETTLATKNFITAGSVNTLLTSYAKTNAVPTVTQFNSLKNRYDSMEQTIGTTNDSVARAVMTSNLWETEVSKVIDDELEQAYETVEGEVPFYEYTPNPTRTLLEGDRSMAIYLPTTADTTMDGKRVIVEMEYKARAGSKGNHASYIQYGTIKSSEPLLYSSLTNVKYHLYIPPGTAKGNIMDLHTDIVNPGNYTWADIISITVSTVEKTQVPVSGTKTGAISTKITQLYDMINLSVLGKEGAMSRIAMGEEGIQIDGKLLHITAKTFIDNAVIKSAMIDTLDAGKITTGTLNANNVNVINLDANSISGNEASFIKAMFTNKHSALQITGDGLTVSKSNGSRTFEVDSTGVNFYSDTGPGAYISTHNIVTWNGSSWVDTGANSVLFASELRHSIGIGYKILTNGKYMTRDAIRLDRSGTGVPELQVNLPIKNIEWQSGTVSGESGTYFRNTQKSAGIWMGDNGKLILITYGKLYNSTSWLNK